MIRAIGLTLGFTGCSGVPPTLLSDMPGLEIIFSASPMRVDVELTYTGADTGACLQLHDSFRATVGDAELVILNPGEGHEPSGPPCVVPSLKLVEPPAADAIVLRDDSLEVTIPTQGRLAPRSFQRIPDGPWVFHLGENVNAQYTPASDLGDTGMLFYEIRFLDPVTGDTDVRDFIPYVATNGKLTFELPPHTGKGQLEVDGSGMLSPWTCEHACCQLRHTALLTQAFEIQP